MTDTSFAARYGPWALVTGASAGIGAEFARQLAARGLDLLLVARRRQRLEELGGQLSQEHGVRAVPVPLDLAAPDLVERLAPSLEGREVGLLVNNAGLGHAADLAGSDLGPQLATLDVNCRAPLLLTHHLLPGMVARGHGGVIFLASVLGHFPLPGLSLYSATKAWNLFLGEGLYEELRERGVDVLSLCPGPTRTEFGEVAGAGTSVGMAPAAVVRAALGGLGRRPAVIPGWANSLGVAALRLLPARLRLYLARTYGFWAAWD